MAVGNTNKTAQIIKNQTTRSHNVAQDQQKKTLSQTSANTPVDAFPTLSPIPSHQTKLNICIQIYGTL